MGDFKILIATPETDASLSKQEMQKGLDAARAGKSKTDNPWSSGSLCAFWWNEGFDYFDVVNDLEKEINNDK